MAEKEVKSHDKNTDHIAEINTVTELIREPAEEISHALLTWYDANKRKLPWRESPSPYHVWISEIMLQQTRVESVIGYYERFLERFPDIRSLAAAEEDEVLKLWEGLGYYSRARNLRKAARQVVECFGGRMPDTAAKLRKLAGIGPYTSAAISSIAYGERVPAIDGNLLRVFARLSAYREEIRTSAAFAAADSFFRKILPQDRPGDFNQAMMDLGAGVCMPGERAVCLKSPGLCPLSVFCMAHAQGLSAQLPVMPVKKLRRAEKRTVLVIRCGDRVLIRRRPSKGLLAGLYEFPNVKGWLSEDEALKSVRELGQEPLNIRPLPEAKHVFTHLEWHMTGYELRTGDFDVLRTGDLPYEVSDEKDVPEDRPGSPRFYASPQHGQSFSASPQHGQSRCFSVSLQELRENYALPGAFLPYLPVEDRLLPCQDCL